MDKSKEIGLKNTIHNLKNNVDYLNTRLDIEIGKNNINNEIIDTTRKKIKELQDFNQYKQQVINSLHSQLKDTNLNNQSLNQSLDQSTSKSSSPSFSEPHLTIDHLYKNINNQKTYKITRLPHVRNINLNDNKKWLLGVEYISITDKNTHTFVREALDFLDKFIPEGQ